MLHLLHALAASPGSAPAASSARRPSISTVAVLELAGARAGRAVIFARCWRSSAARQAEVACAAGDASPVEQPLLGAVSAARALLLLAAPRATGLTADALDQVADHALDVAAVVADLGVLGRLDLDERRADELRQPAGDLGLADAGRADQDDVLGRDVVAQLGGELLPPPAVAEGDGDGPLGRRPGRRCSGPARRRSGAGVRSSVRLLQFTASSTVDLVVRVDADARRRSPATRGRSARGSGGVVQQGARRGQGVAAAGADGEDAVVGWITSPVPLRSSGCSRSATTSIASAGAASGRSASPWPARSRRGHVACGSP